MEKRIENGGAALQRAVKAAQRVSAANARDRKLAERRLRTEMRLVDAARRQIKRDVRKRFGDPFSRVVSRIDNLENRHPVNWLTAAIQVAGVEKIAEAAGRRPATVRQWLKRENPTGIRFNGEMLENIGKAAGICDLATWFDLFFGIRLKSTTARPAQRRGNHES